MATNVSFWAGSWRRVPTQLGREARFRLDMLNRNGSARVSPPGCLKDFHMASQSTFLVLGATGGTGKHFVAQALADGHRVRALVRSPSKLLLKEESLDVRHGSITDSIDMDDLTSNIDFVISMLGDKQLQRHSMINTEFVKRLVPAMRRQGVKRFLYQAGGLSRPYGGHLPPLFWAIRKTLALDYDGQHRDNEAVMEYLATEAGDIEWIVQRAGI